jgi:hypothetical protein
MLNRRTDQQRLVDGLAQLNGGGATQVSHRDRNNISAGPRGWHDDAGGEHNVDQADVVAERRAEFEKNKIMGAEGRSRIGVKTSLEVLGAGFSVMLLPSVPHNAAGID